MCRCSFIIILTELFNLGEDEAEAAAPNQHTISHIKSESWQNDPFHLHFGLVERLKFGLNTIVSW